MESQDQASALRQLNPQAKPVNPASRRLRCIAVGSGKGGVGKTLVSVGLGYCLARRGKRVLLVDADLGLANVDLQMGINPTHTLQDVIFGKCTLEQAVVPVPEGPDVLAAASGSAEMVDMGNARRQAFVDELVRFAAHYDFLVIDVGAGIGQGVTAFMSAAPEVLVVVANEPTSIMDAYALIKTLNKSPDPPVITAVINMVRTVEEGFQLAQRLNAITQRYLGLDLPVGGIVPYDDKVVTAIRLRRPVMVHAATSAPACALDSIAEFVVSGRSYMRVGPRSQDALFDKLLSLGQARGEAVSA